MLAKTYEPQAVEQEIYTFWETNRLFKPEAAQECSTGQSFSLVIPPPNVTGTLHMGHALDCTIQDILIRWHRMCGDRTLWMPGTDHAGIATQNVVERQLRAEGKTKHDLGRDAFLELVWEWARARKGDILGQFRRLGISPDWERERFTLDEGLSKAVRVAFKTLYDQGLIYQGTYIVNWCPRCTSAISDIETDYVDEESHLWEIAYPLAEDSTKALVVATTRPETMFGDVAIAVHPEDPRYQAYIGKTVRLPLTEKQIPIIADPVVEREFGTGVLKITPAHDPNDFAVGMRHQLEPVWVIDTDGKLVAEAPIPQALQGMERFDARVKTEQLLTEAGALVRKQEHHHRVGHCQRCSTTIEPLLSKQWFVKTRPLADQALKAVETGELRFIPERWTKDFVRWMTDIQDWCISRQLWWGHTIPAWTCNDCGHLMIEIEAPVVCAQCQSKGLTQETDVLDTWFSSGLWPFSTMGWPDTAAPDLKTFYPTSVLVTGFDIIFFWVARMVMFGYGLTGQSPFNTVYIHGLIRDEKGQKMSKSKGNTVDPVEVIEQTGCDGFRFALTSLITYGGQDIKLAKDKIELGKLFANKLWNASRFVMMNLEGVDDAPIDRSSLSVMDQWILSRYNTVVAEVNANLAAFKFGEVASILYEFTWNAFCDWYVEYAKKQLRDEAYAMNTKRVLLTVLTGILKLLHPIMPYITEEIWRKLPHQKGLSISVTAFPQVDESLQMPELEEDVEFTLSAVRAIRNIRQQYNVPHPQEIPVVIEAGQASEARAIEAGQAILHHFVKLSDLKVERVQNGVLGLKLKNAATNLIGQSRVLVPLEGIIDVGQEIGRLEKKKLVLKKEQEQLFRMMSNFEFLEKAPPEVIEKNKTRLSEVNQQLQGIDEQLKDLNP